MFRIFTCFLLALWGSACHALYNEINGEKCSVEYTMGYEYNRFHNIADLMDTTDNDNQGVLLKFYAQAISNAHVMLTNEPSSYGYEIVLGGGSNRFSEIRRSKREAPVVTVNTLKILDAKNATGFWIRVNRELGMIEVGIGSNQLPFMFWQDRVPIPVNYFAFGAWDGVVCKWLFNCRRPALERTDGVKKFLTNTERLKKNILKNHGPFSVSSSPPVNEQQFLNVAITSDFKFVHLDVMTSTLTLQGFATFEWSDNSISWNPSDYKNISKLHLLNYELWQPELVLHNAFDPAKSMFSEEKISVDNNGNVIWRPKFSVKSKCDVNLKSWPLDQHKCILLLSTWSHKISKIFYQVKETNSNSKCFQVAYSDWKLDSITSSYVEDDTPWDDIVVPMYKDGDDDTDTQTSLQLVVEISRNTKILEKLFYAPLLLISCLWLSSFCIMSDVSSKITTICISLVLSTLTVVFMSTYVPIFVESPPNLLVAYLRLTLWMSTDAFVSSCLIAARKRTAARGSRHPPFALTRSLTTPAVARLLMLPKLEPVAGGDGGDGGGYGLLLDVGQCRNDATGRQEPQPTASAADNVVTLWDIVFVAFERVVFAVYLVVTMTTVLWPSW